MPPVPPSPLLLTLTFPDLASLANPTSAIARIAESARTTSSLLVRVRFAFPFPTTSTPSHVATSSLSSHPSLAEVQPEESSSSSGVPPAPPAAKGDAFEILERLLSSLYSAATRVFVAEDRPLDTVDVVLELMRGIPVCWLSGRREEFTIEAAASGKGKAVAENESWKGQYPVVALGGTFDHLHAGHKILLSLSAYLTDERLIVGVTDENLLLKKVLAQHLEPLSVRMERVKAFLELVRPTITHDVVAIQDIYGPTAWDEEVRALVVSDETRKGGEAVNAERGKKKLNELDVFVISLMGEEGDTDGLVETKMGSTGLRKWIDAKQKEKARADTTV